MDVSVHVALPLTEMESARLYSSDGRGVNIAYTVLYGWSEPPQTAMSLARESPSVITARKPEFVVTVVSGSTTTAFFVAVVAPT